jgi:hypothetical protein
MLLPCVSLGGLWLLGGDKLADRVLSRGTESPMCLAENSGATLGATLYRNYVPLGATLCEA